MNRSFARAVLATLVVAGGIVSTDANAAFLVRRDPLLDPSEPMGEGIIKPADGVRITVTGDGGANFVNVGVGIFSLEAAPSPPGTTFSDLITFCLEINQVLDWAEAVHTYNDVSLATGITAGQSNMIGRLWNNSFASVLGDVSGERGERAAAFQAAIWEIVEDGTGTLDVAAGNFQIQCATAGDVCTYAAGFLTGLGSGPQDPTLIRLASDTQQDLIAFRGGSGGLGDPDPVPAPATLLVLGTALAGLGALRRRA
ncbi:MAG: PEP-CTERM sorting domain-containing protein [Alphaproteobacteria bacterium]|nr:PEP-CTERM sorting domain-containing protein [Alphaproteobacteria bacterium]